MKLYDIILRDLGRTGDKLRKLPKNTSSDAQYRYFDSILCSLSFYDLLTFLRLCDWNNSHHSLNGDGFIQLTTFVLVE
jgi:hypothetical protein